MLLNGVTKIFTETRPLDTFTYCTSFSNFARGVESFDFSKINFVVSQKSDIRSKGYPLLGSARGTKEAVDRFIRRKIIGDERGQRKRNKHIKKQRSNQVQAARRLTAQLLHVWIDVIMVASYKCVPTREPGRVALLL